MLMSTSFWESSLRLGLSRRWLQVYVIYGDVEWWRNPCSWKQLHHTFRVVRVRRTSPVWLMNLLLSSSKISRTSEIILPCLLLHTINLWCASKFFCEHQLSLGLVLGGFGGGGNTSHSKHHIFDICSQIAISWRYIKRGSLIVVKGCDYCSFQISLIWKRFTTKQIAFSARLKAIMSD